MSSSDLTRRKPAPKPDALIQDYISDLWGIGPAVRNSEPPPDSVCAKAQASSVEVESIERSYSLVTTLKYQLVSDLEVIRSQTDLLILLFSNLYLLRRPLSAKVRQCILSSSEQLIDDFNAAYWLTELSKKGVLSEI